MLIFMPALALCTGNDGVLCNTLLLVTSLVVMPHGERMRFTTSTDLYFCSFWHWLHCVHLCFVFHFVFCLFIYSAVRRVGDMDLFESEWVLIEEERSDGLCRRLFMKWKRAQCNEHNAEKRRWILFECKEKMNGMETRTHSRIGNGHSMQLDDYENG